MKKLLDSFKSSKDFYQKLGAEGMAGLTSPERNRAYVKLLEKILPKHGKILDCACGYGRLTIPLAHKGFTLEGIDLSSCLIKAAKNFAKKEALTIPFTIGNMCKLPYRENTFAALFCMWSSFNHLLTEKDQLKALNEMLRVITPGGLILIDLPSSQSFTKEATLTGSFIDDAQRVFKEDVNGIENNVYFHDKKSLTHLLNQLKNCNSSLVLKTINTRKRLFVNIVKY